MKVTVAVITFNHEAFIAEALDSILMQETTFDWNIVIGEDGSKDGTRSICEAYATSHPEKIRLLPAQPNMGMMENFIRVFNACEGAYMAFTEGDDFWTDRHKLQKQAEHLDANPDQSLCFHAVRQWFTWNGENASRRFPEAISSTTFGTEDLLKGWFIPSTSVMLRKYPEFRFPEWFRYAKSGDIPLLLLYSLLGKIGYMDELMGVYRIHDHGISRTHRGYQKISAMIYILEQFNIQTSFRFRKAIESSIIREIDLHYPGNQNTSEHEAHAAGNPGTESTTRLSLHKRLLKRLHAIFYS